jgi:cold shock CspA family protein
MTRGTVKFYKEDKGYGAIASPDLPDGFDAWVHFSAIEGDGYRSLEVGASASCNDRRELADQRSEIQIFDAASVNPVRR